MEMNKQRKMLVGVLCLGLGGLVVDRFVIGAPEAAAAAEGELADVVPPELEPVTIETPSSRAEDQPAKALPSYASLTERLLVAQAQQVADPQGASREDPFALPPQWQSDKTTPPTQRDPNPDPDRISDLFKLDGTVRSVIDGKEELLAVISGAGLDGRAIRVGQKVRVPNNDGTYDLYELVEVGTRYVTWLSERSQKRITMRVEEVL